jgi:hypothetical protein
MSIDEANTNSYMIAFTGRWGNTPLGDRLTVWQPIAKNGFHLGGATRETYKNEIWLCLFWFRTYTTIAICELLEWLILHIQYCLWLKHLSYMKVVYLWAYTQRIQCLTHPLLWISACKKMLKCNSEYSIAENVERKVPQGYSAVL